LEIVNYKDVREFSGAFKGDVTDRFIKRIHKLLMKGLKGNFGTVTQGGTNKEILLSNK
jgi:hypothetical protein